MIRVLLADDHRLVMGAVGRVLSEEKGISVVGEARSGEEAVSMCTEHSPNVVIMSLFVPGIGGMEATRRILRLERDIRIIALSNRADGPFPEQMLRIGATGFLTKSADTRELINCVRKVFFGQRYVSSDVAQALAFSSFQDADPNPFGSLSNREMQIMMMVVNCHKVHEISGNLHLSPKTVNSYRYRIFEKLNVSSDVEMALMAVRHGVLDPENVPLQATS